MRGDHAHAFGQAVSDEIELAFVSASGGINEVHIHRPAPALRHGDAGEARALHHVDHAGLDEGVDLIAHGFDLNPVNRCRITEAAHVGDVDEVVAIGFGFPNDSGIHQFLPLDLARHGPQIAINERGVIGREVIAFSACFANAEFWVERRAERPCKHPHPPALTGFGFDAEAVGITSGFDPAVQGGWKIRDSGFIGIPGFQNVREVAHAHQQRRWHRVIETKITGLTGKRDLQRFITGSAAEQGGGELFTLHAAGWKNGQRAMIGSDVREIITIAAGVKNALLHFHAVFAVRRQQGA